jgi:hypothetical protein
MASALVSMAVPRAQPTAVESQMPCRQQAGKHKSDVLQAAGRAGTGRPWRMREEGRGAGERRGTREKRDANLLPF